MLSCYEETELLGHKVTKQCWFLGENDILTNPWSSRISLLSLWLHTVVTQSVMATASGDREELLLQNTQAPATWSKGESLSDSSLVLISASKACDKQLASSDSIQYRVVVQICTSQFTAISKWEKDG